MAIATVDDIAAALAVAQRQPFLKTFTAAKSAGSYLSSWRMAGLPGAAAAPPANNAGSGYTCDKSTAGALNYANGSVQNYLARLAASGTQRGTLILVDRLWQCITTGFAAATYTVTTPGSLPTRITGSGAGCEIWCEQSAAAGAASGTLTVNYLDTGGAAGAGVIAAVVSAPVAGQMQPVPLAVGDTGVSGIVSAVNSATWTSGTFGITVVKRIAEIPLQNAIGAGTVLDWAQCLAAVPDNACLGFIYLAEVTTAAAFGGQLHIIDK